MKARKELFEFSSHKRTERLMKLLDGSIKPTQEDIKLLFSEWKQGESYGEVATNLKDFAQWIIDGAEVTW